MTLLRILLCCLLVGIPDLAARAEPLSEDAKQAFARGFVLLEQQKTAIIPDSPRVRLTQGFAPAYPDPDTIVGYVRVAVQLSKHSDRLEEFLFAYRDAKWVLTRYDTGSATNGLPAKMTIPKPLSDEAARKVQACFSP